MKKLMAQAGLIKGTRNISNDFLADPTTFLGTRAISAVMIDDISKAPLTAGLNNFTMKRHISNRHRLVCLERHEDDPKSPLIRAYWVPQGESCRIPVHPKNHDTYVFTPDFSGCSIRVDQLDKDSYTVWHVTGGDGKMANEYDSHADHKRSWGNVAQMNPEHYGTAAQPRGFALLNYRDGAWKILHQSVDSHEGVGKIRGELQVRDPQVVSGSGAIPVAVLQGPSIQPARGTIPSSPKVEPATSGSGEVSEMDITENSHVV
jgi:hypothetical protein